MSSSLGSSMHHACIPLLFFFFTIFSISSSIEISCTDSCGVNIPAESAATTNPLPIADTFHLAGYHSGGAWLFEPARLPLPRSFFFNIYNVSATVAPGILKVDGGITLRGNRLPAGHRDPVASRALLKQPEMFLRGEMVAFGLSGSYSLTSGKLCMIGFGFGPREEGKSLQLCACLKLDFPETSNIYSSIVTGILEISDASNGSSRSDQFALLAYGQRGYKYALSTLDIHRPCPRALQLKDFCRFLSDYNELPFELDYTRNCRKTKCNPFHMNLQFMVMKGIKCSPEDGRLRMYLEFSNNGLSDFLAPLLPEVTLVSEGLWDRKSNQLRVAACRLLDVGNSVDRASVGDCTVGLSLWFPATLSVRNTRPIVGQIWSNRNDTDPSFFSMVKFRTPAFSYRPVPEIMYKYTKMEAVRKLCLNNIHRDSMDGSYQVVNTFKLGTYYIALINSLGESVSVGMRPVALGEIPHSDLKMDSSQLLRTNQSMTIWNVSYEISYFFHYLSSDEFEKIDIAAEGLYNTANGVICMAGCRKLKPSAVEIWTTDDDPMDCNILIDIQVLVSRKGTMRVNGTISSTREASDPLYFEPLKISSSAMHSERVRISIWRLNVRVTVVATSFVISFVSIGLQLSYAKNNPDSLNFISITMLMLLNLGNLLRSLFSFQALSFMTSRRHDIDLLQGVGWVGLNESLLLITTSLVLWPSFRLVHRVRIARSKGSGSNWRAAKWNYVRASFPLYFFIALLLYTAIYGSLLHPSLRENLVSSTSLLLEAFLLPQLIRNVYLSSNGKTLIPSFYIGTTVARALPHLYDSYRPCRNSLNVKLLSRFETSNWDFGSSFWDLVFPCVGMSFALLIFLQQRFGSHCIHPLRIWKTSAYKKNPKFT